jgi:hypothetical protein
LPAYDTSRDHAIEALKASHAGAGHLSRADTHIGTLGPGGDGQPAIECQKVDDPANPLQWVTIPDVVVGNPCPTDWLGHTHSAVGLKCTLVGGIPRWEQA